MSYNQKQIKTDVNDKPVPQYFNKDLQDFEVLEGQSGASKVITYDSGGNESNVNIAVQPILDKLSQLTGTVMDEETRKSNELSRTEFYDQLQLLLFHGELKGEKGDIGNGLEYIWDGTKLGVRVAGQIDYIFVDLKGDKGDKGDTGEQGPKGETGEKGDKGEQGVAGSVPIEVVTQAEYDDLTPIDNVFYYIKEV